MKVTKTSTQPAFQPIELKITIESQEEFYAILNLSSGYNSVPNVLVNEKEIFEECRESVEEFLKQICSALNRLQNSSKSSLKALRSPLNPLTNG